jgi:protein gp37
MVSPTSPDVNEGRLYGLTKIESVTDTPPERVAHSLQKTPARQSPTPLGPGRKDLWHARIPADFIQRVFDVMVDTPQHTYQLLTKRPRRLTRMAASLPWPRNVWVGVSVERQEQAWRVAELRKVPAAVRFISAEPLIGPLDLDLAGMDWLIAGGESGANRRPMDERWVLNLRDQCVSSGTAFFFKQWGGAHPKTGGRTLDGRTWDDMPDQSLKRMLEPTNR